LQLLEHTGKSFSDVGKNGNAVSISNISEVSSGSIVVINGRLTWLEHSTHAVGLID